MLKLFVTLASALFVAQGCLTFNGQELPRREVTPPSAPPIVTLKVGEVRQLLNGAESALKPMLSARGVGELELEQALRIWKQRGLIADWGKPGALRTEPRFELAISGTQDEQASLFAAAVSGATLLLLPASTTLVYDWRFQLTDRTSRKVYEVPVQRSVSIWSHLLMLPMLPLMPVGAYHGQRDQALYVFSELERAGAWK